MAYGTITTLLLAALFTMDVGFGYDGPVYTWPLPSDNPLLEIINEVNHGKKGCSLSSGILHSTLQYSGIQTTGISSSYADVIAGDATEYNDYAFAIFASANDIFGGTIFHYKQDQSAVDPSEQKIKDVILWYNNTHLVAETKGPNDEDYGSVSDEIVASDLLNTWAGFGVSFDLSKPKITLMTNTGISLEVSTRNNAPLGGPGRIRVGATFDDSHPSYNGNLICLNMYNFKISANDLTDRCIHECAVSNWGHVTAAPSVETCDEFRGYFEIKQRDTMLELSVTSLDSMTTKSRVKCADFCLRTDLCWSFTINKVTGVCKLFDGDYSSNGVSSAGTHYYMRRDVCC